MIYRHLILCLLSFIIVFDVFTVVICYARIISSSGIIIFSRTDMPLPVYTQCVPPECIHHIVISPVLIKINEFCSILFL